MRQYIDFLDDCNRDYFIEKGKERINKLKRFDKLSFFLVYYFSMISSMFFTFIITLRFDRTIDVIKYFRKMVSYKVGKALHEEEVEKRKEEFNNKIES